MDTDKLIRRAVHLSAPLFTVYYLFPEHIGDFSRESVLVTLWAIYMLFEVWRLHAKPEIPGLRPYENDRPSAAAWFVTGVTVTFLLLPWEYAFPVLLGMGLVDPLNGELRRAESKMYPVIPAMVYFILTLTCLGLTVGWTMLMLIASVATTIMAIWSESIRSDLVDDDFLMVVVPALTLTFILALPF